MCVECLIGKCENKETNSLSGHRAEFHTVQNSSRVRQKGGVPGPPTLNPPPRHRRCPGPASPGHGLLAEQEQDDWVLSLSRLF